LKNGDPIATNWDDLTDGELIRDIRIDQDGMTLATCSRESDPLCFVWTNTDANGQLDLPNNGCLGLTWGNQAGMNVAPAQSGRYDRAEGSWTDRSKAWDCQTFLWLYCFEQPPPDP
jgi:hypothetical protein